MAQLVQLLPMHELTKLQAVGQHKLITSNPDFRAPFIYLLDLDITKFLLIYIDLQIKTSDIILPPLGVKTVPLQKGHTTFLELGQIDIANLVKCNLFFPHVPKSQTKCPQRLCIYQSGGVKAFIRPNSILTPLETN